MTEQALFDKDAPDSVLKARSKRQSQVVRKADGNEAKEDLYSMLEVNGWHRPLIKGLVSRTIILKERLDKYNAKWAPLKAELGQPDKPRRTRAYKVVKGDNIDEMFAAALQRRQSSVKVVRLAEGKYMFGSKKILAKIVNGKLVVRVGGGYMSVDEFIEQYGEMELMKSMAAEEHEDLFPLEESLRKGRTDTTGNYDRQSPKIRRLREKANAIMTDSQYNAGLR